MDIIDIPLAPDHDPAALVERIERAAEASGLLIGARTTLQSYPGSTHWHLKQLGANGVLELTYWPKAGRLWFAIHINRRGDWIAAAIGRMRAWIVQDA